MSDKDTREAPDDDDNWVTVGARPRHRAAPPPSAATHNTGGSRKKRLDQPAAARRSEPRENWHLVMRSRQALTKLRDEDFALTRLGQVHAGEPRRADPRPANRSRLGARFPTNMASDRPNRPPAVLRRPVRFAMPKFDVPLRSETDFPSLRGGTKPAAPPAAVNEKRRSSVALKLDESLRSMAGASAQQGESGAGPAPAATPPPPMRTVAYSDSVSWRARKSERRDLVRGDIREDVAMLQTATAQKNPAVSPPAAADTSTGSAISGNSPQKKKEKEKRLLKKAKKKESELILARLNASKDTHVQLMTADAFERLHGAHASRWRRSQAETVDLRAAGQYPTLEETAISTAVSAAAVSAAAASAAAASAAAASAAAAAQNSPQDSPQRDSPQQEPQPPDRREGGGIKTFSYSRMLRELPKTLPPPMDVEELVEAKEAKRKAPKKRAPIETSLMDLAEQMPTSRAKRVEVVRGLQRTPPRRVVPLARLTGNRLDSTVMVQKRGKERTKKKKPTLLKRIILRERAERRRKAGLEPVAAALALLAGLTVEEERGDGDRQQEKQETGEGSSASEESSPAAVQPGAPPAQADAVPAARTPPPQSVVALASVVKQNTTPLKQDAAASQKRDSGLTVQSVPSGASQQTSPAPVQNIILVVKQEPLSPTSSQNATPETKPIAVPAQKPTLVVKQEPLSPTSSQNTTPETKPIAVPVQKITLVVKQEPLSPTSSQNATPETKPIAVPAQKPTMVVKQEPLSSTSSQNATPETKLTAALSTSSTQKATPEIKQAVTPKETDEKPAAAPISDAKDPASAVPTATDGGDSDDDAPPSRGPDYTPCITVDPKLLIHSRKFREYCQQTLSPDIDESARHLLQDLARFQDRLYNRDPIKARSRRRLVYGLREVSKHLAIKKLACVILAPNIEKIETAGGLDQAVQRLLTLASEREVPLVFALKRRALGHACKKPVPVSCVGIFNYQGSEDNYKRMMQLAEAAQERYRVMVAEVERALQPKEEELSPAEQLLGVIDSIGRQQPPQPPVSEGAPDDPTHSLLAKLRSVTLGS